MLRALNETLERCGAEQRRLLDVLAETCVNAAALGCDTIMTATGAQSGSVAQAADNLRRAGDVVARHGLIEKGYAGYLSYEAPNPALWAKPPEVVAREGAAATRALLASARSGLSRS